jgi:hypothetical protein
MLGGGGGVGAHYPITSSIARPVQAAAASQAPRGLQGPRRIASKKVEKTIATSARQLQLDPSNKDSTYLVWIMRSFVTRRVYSGAVRREPLLGVTVSGSDEQKKQRVPARSFHATQRSESSLAILTTSLGVASIALGTSYAMQAWEQWKEDPSWSAKSFYDGPFEDPMTRREAARILGIR